MCHATMLRDILQNVISHSVPIDRILSFEENKNRKREEGREGEREQKDRVADFSHGKIIKKTLMQPEGKKRTLQ